MKFTAIKHKDVRGKELMYLKVENNGQEVLINIGQKSYNAIKLITEAEEKPKTEQKVKAA